MTAANLHRACLVLGLCAVLSVPAGRATAETYILKLVGGGEFTSRYQPEEASWDSETVLLLTEHGNWIAVAKADVENVTTATENKGFGRVIDTTTISLGLKVNDAPVPGEGEGERQPNSLDLLRQYLDRPQQPTYSVDQFVEPSDAGTGTSGLPVSYGTGYSDVLLPLGPAGSAGPQ